VSPGRQRALAAAIHGATVHEVDGVHNAVATSAERFVPTFLEACASVVRRLPA
jgi:3-oxoadipate enol-lactonase